MQSALTKYAAKYAFQKALKQDQNKYKNKKADDPYDPYYQMIPHPRKPGKMKKVKKEVPAYIPAHDADILARARKSAYRLDFCLFNFLGLRFGWSSVIALVPFIGDGADGLMALRLINKMNKIEGRLPNQILMLMIMNLAIDFLVGLIPFVGDLADAAIKCNSKNVRLLEKHLDKKYKPREVIEEEKRLPEARRPRPATVFEDFSDEEEDRRNTFDDVQDNVRQPSRAYSGRRDRVVDEEMGLPRSGTAQASKQKPGRESSKRNR